MRKSNVHERVKESDESAGIAWDGTSSGIRRNGIGPKPIAKLALRISLGYQG